MGLDIDQLWNNAKEAADKGMNDLLKSGGNAAIGYLEQQGINILNADSQKHMQDAQAATTAIMSRPSSANSFGAYLSGIVQNSGLKTYGPGVILAVAVVGVAAVFLFRK